MVIIKTRSIMFNSSLFSIFTDHLLSFFKLKMEIYFKNFDSHIRYTVGGVSPQPSSVA